MTKKEFNEFIDCHVYGRGKGKINAIFFDWKDGDGFRGFKFMVWAYIEEAKKAELYQHLYDWVFNDVNLPYYIKYRFAETDEKRFRVPVTANGLR